LSQQQAAFQFEVEFPQRFQPLRDISGSSVPSFEKFDHKSGQAKRSIPEPELKLAKSA